jgi:Zn-dependent alcohol dehydrogenase
VKIKAAVLEAMGAVYPYAVSRPLRIDEVDLAPSGADEVLTEIAAAGLCHSELSVTNGDRPRPMPMALGHEAAGRDIPRYIDLYMQGRLPANQLLTGRLRLDEINHGFYLLHEGKAIRQVVMFD